jgi:alpha-1,2-mannosyltransferase
MAAGLIVVANRSGGPLMDIVMEYDGSRNGFLAVDENDYAEAIKAIIHMTPQCRAVIRAQARASVDRFSERQFIKSFLEAVQASLFR